MKKLLIIASLCLFGTGPAQAQLFIEQGKIALDVRPGERVAESLIIHNTSEQGVEVRVYWEDFQYVEPFDGKKKFSPAGRGGNSMVQWVSFSPQVFKLPPYTKRKISYTIDVPENAEGGHYGVLFFERTVAESQSGAALNIITRVGTLFFVEVLPKIKQAQVSGVRFEADRLTAQFENNGNVILIPEGVYYIMSSEGLVVDRGEIDKIYLPPGKEASYNFAISNSLPPGTYTMVMTIGLGSGDVLVKEVDFQKSSSLNHTITHIRD